MEERLYKQDTRSDQHDSGKDSGLATAESSDELIQEEEVASSKDRNSER